MRRRSLLVVLLLLEGCAARLSTQAKTAQPWVGRSRMMLIEQFGPPTEITKDGESEVYVYTETRTQTVYTPAVTVKGGKKSEPITVAQPTAQSGTYVARRVMYWINADGIITSVHVQSQ